MLQQYRLTSLRGMLRAFLANFCLRMEQTRGPLPWPWTPLRKLFHLLHVFVQPPFRNRKFRGSSRNFHVLRLGGRYGLEFKLVMPNPISSCPTLGLSLQGPASTAAHVSHYMQYHRSYRKGRCISRTEQGQSVRKFRLDWSEMTAIIDLTVLLVMTADFEYQKISQFRIKKSR